MNQHLLMTDDFIDITITIGQPKIHVSQNFISASMSAAVNGYIIGPHFLNVVQWYTHRCHVQWFSPKYTATIFRRCWPCYQTTPMNATRRRRSLLCS